MDENRQKELIAKLEALHLSIESDFIDQYPVLFKDLYQDVLEVISPIRFSGSDETRATELYRLVKLKKQIAALITGNKDYVKATQEVTKGLLQIRDLTDEYFGVIIEGYKPRQELYKAIVDSSLKATEDALLGTGIQDNLAKPIVDTLRSTLIKKTGKPQVEDVIKKMILGGPDNKPLLESHLRRMTNDSVMFFQRTYLDTVSADLNISYYIYSGSIIRDSRPFCVARAGKVWKKTTIESWAKLNWAGKIPGTTAQTIFVNVGGYGPCRHVLFPATKAQFTIQEKKK